MEELEKRVNEIEQRIAFWKGAFIVASAGILAWLGVTTWVSVPIEVNRQLVGKVGAETIARVKQLNDEFDKIGSNSGVAAKELGILDIKGELAKKVSIGTNYRLRANTASAWDAAVHDGKGSNGGAITL